MLPEWKNTTTLSGGHSVKESLSQVVTVSGSHLVDLVRWTQCLGVTIVRWTVVLSEMVNIPDCQGGHLVRWIVG